MIYRSITIAFFSLAMATAAMAQTGSGNTSSQKGVADPVTGTVGNSKTGHITNDAGSTTMMPMNNSSQKGVADPTTGSVGNSKTGDITKDSGATTTMPMDCSSAKGTTGTTTGGSGNGNKGNCP